MQKTSFMSKQVGNQQPVVIGDIIAARMNDEGQQIVRKSVTPEGSRNVVAVHKRNNENFNVMERTSNGGKQKKIKQFKVSDMNTLKKVLTPRVNSVIRENSKKKSGKGKKRSSRGKKTSSKAKKASGKGRKPSGKGKKSSGKGKK
mgnify:CR=1 FL=1